MAPHELTPVPPTPSTCSPSECGGNPDGELGFTFSFPTEQTAINAGTLITWNKDFAASNVIGQDVVWLLQQELLERGINLRVCALANDTVGTMEAAAYRFPETAMGVILGTGTNAAYLEKASNVPKWAGPPCDDMVINTEWGNLGMGSLMNRYDMAVDRASDNPGAQQLEKMISGMYLGELTRVTLSDPTVRNAFSAQCAAEMQMAFYAKLSLPTAAMSAMEADTSPTLSEVGRVLAAAGVVSSTVADRVLVREACVCVSSRAAYLSAVGVASLLHLTEHNDVCKIAVDGTVFECYPFFKERMERGLELMLGTQRAHAVDLILAKDGSGVGAAIIAAIVP
jgi:hexokinase